MIILIIGGSGSGKSAYAEKLMTELTRYSNTASYYIATMTSDDDESRRRIERHRSMRSSRGFITVEQPSDLDILELTDQDTQNEALPGALLESMSNLVANEMFIQGKNPETAGARIAAGINSLAAQTENLIIVSDNVFEDGFSYDSMSEYYMKILGASNIMIANMADTVVEIRAGIPICLKGSIECR